MKGVSTHVLDTARGVPAIDISVLLERQNHSGQWQTVGLARTDGEGRCAQLVPERENLSPGTYRLAFDTASYYSTQKITGLYPLVQVTFVVREGETHFHIPLLLSPYGYTTYRGR